MPARPPFPEIASLLADARAAKDWSQEEAAHRIGVSLAAYGRWERGLRRPGRRHVHAVARTLSIDEELLALPVEPRQPVPPELEDVFYELNDRVAAMNDKIDRLARLVAYAVRAQGVRLPADQEIAAAVEEAVATRDEAGRLPSPAAPPSPRRRRAPARGAT